MAPDFRPVGLIQQALGVLAFSQIDRDFCACCITLVNSLRACSKFYLARWMSCMLGSWASVSALPTSLLFCSSCCSDNLLKVVVPLVFVSAIIYYSGEKVSKLL